MIGRSAVPFCAQVCRAVERSRARGRVAIVVLDNLGLHTWRGSKHLRELLDEPFLAAAIGRFAAMRADLQAAHERQELR